MIQVFLQQLFATPLLLFSLLLFTLSYKRNYHHASNTTQIFIYIFIYVLGIEGIDNFKEGMHIRFASESDKGGDKLPGGVYGTSVSLEKAVSQPHFQTYLHNFRMFCLTSHLSPSFFSIFIMRGMISFFKFSSSNTIFKILITLF